MKLTVRYAAQNELHRVNELRETVSELHANGRSDIFRHGFCDELQQYVYEAFNADDTDIIVALTDDTVCGFAVVRYVNKAESPYMCARHFYHIEELGVDADYRRQGVATSLINFCRKEAKRMKFDRMELDVWEFNEGALKFYEAVGFKTYRRYMETSL